MKSLIVIFTILTLAIFSFFESTILRAEEINFKAEVQNYSFQAASFSGHLTYVRVYKNGIWWIYVYDGVVLIDIYPE